MEKEIRREVVKSLYGYYLGNCIVSVQTKEHFNETSVRQSLKKLEIEQLREIAPQLFANIESIYDILDSNVVLNELYPKYLEAEQNSRWSEGKSMNYIYSKPLKNYGDFLSFFSGTLQETGISTKQRLIAPIKLDQTNVMLSETSKQAKKILDKDGQIILQGAPGCGKTYITTELAVFICDGVIPSTRGELKKRYKELVDEKRIGFTTFHQSLDYEEFVEGLKPVIGRQNEEMVFEVKSGLFKSICKHAEDNDEPHVLIIDEINRANISKVLGELITLLEKSKRIGQSDEFMARLPYSGELFGVPNNLFIVGTMNTADRSVGYIDYAIRRRFAFLSMKPDESVIEEFFETHGTQELKKQEINLFNKVRHIIEDYKSEDFDLNDILIGHSYFLSENQESFELNLKYKIVPLLIEYMRDGILENSKELNRIIQELGEKEKDQVVHLAPEMPMIESPENLNDAVDSING